ncbi:uncharacterized protein LOC111365429 [Olea europaea var. sylvestris]|uniref:uncharacterized protein LOC111365429 n=1 Tax=Olea europaea var. sylvestris TaxID=158386 RepID=UPI000C1D12C5|nr:uncharacterized protein LOC111365429 [Olea europaea var. sylvestris]
MRDVRRAYTRVPINYAGLETTPAQLRYEEMSKGFAQVADLAADDEMLSRAIMEWIKLQCEDMMTTRSGGSSNLIPSRTTQVSNDCTDVSKLASGSICDPQVARLKGAPRKLRKRSPLEITSKKAKSSGTSSTTMPPRSSNTNMVDDAMNFQLPQQYSMPTPTSYLPSDTLTPLSLSQLSMSTPFSLSQCVPFGNLVSPFAASIRQNSQCQPSANYYQNLLDHSGSL